MKKNSLVLALAFLLAIPLVGQIRTGNIFGKVVDQEGNPLPGVTVTLTGSLTAPVTAITSAEGTFRFLSLSPARDYTIKLELSGFKTKIETGIIVNVGSNTNLTLVMEQGILEEQITVTAITPMVDTKKTAVGTNVTQEVLQSLPTARDPWVILQMAPSIIVDRENVGGSESGQQSNYVARGAATYNNNVWSMDGIVITDPAAIGASPSYYDFDAFEEMQITVGGSDVTVQTGGIALNMVTRRGGNRVSLGGRFYVVDEKFQAQNAEKVAELKKKEPGLVGVNRIRNNKDYGFNMGMPIVKDKAWLWASYGIQDIKTNTVYGTPDDTLLENYAAKINLQLIPANRFEAFVHIGGKKKWGRSATAQNPEGLYQQGRYHFGSPIVKFQDEHMFGNNLFLSLKYNYYDAGFSLTPMTDLEFKLMPIWDVKAQRYYGSQASRYYVERPVTQINFLANYFNDNLFGAAHDFKIGFEWGDRNQYVESVWSGNCMVYRNYNTPTVDFTGDGLPDIPTDPKFYRFEIWRGYYSYQNVKALSAYVSDTITVGRFNIILGLRWDQQTPSINPFKLYAVDKESGAWKDNVTPKTADLLDKWLPGLEIPRLYVEPVEGGKYRWITWSPRLGFTWDVFGDGKTIFKLSAATYGDFMGTGVADWARPGGVSGWMDFWWWDNNGDSKIDYTELYWATIANYQLYRVFDDGGNFIGNWADAAGSYWGSYDYTNPTKTQKPYYTTRKDAQSSRTSELMITLQRELFTDFAIELVGTYRRYDKFSWDLLWWPDAQGKRMYEDQSMWISAGRPPSTIPGIGDIKEAKNHDWYYQSVQRTTYTPYSERQLRPDYYQDYYGLDIILNKRLSNRWMLNANFTIQDQAQHFGEKGYMNPNNIWAYDGQPQAAYIGAASGKINQYTYSRWMFKMGGLYQLPFDINVSATLNVREGWIINEYFTLVDYRLPNPKSRSSDIIMSPFGSIKLPTFYNISLRVEKMIRAGDYGRIYVMADVFNLLNNTIENRRYQKYYGTYYIYPNPAQNTFVPYAYNYSLNEVLNPRALRLGVRFEF